jgi:uncharacterized repeat protein (TIGR01451 family)
MFLFLLRRWFASSVFCRRRRLRDAKRKCRLSLEPLELRLTPTNLSGRFTSNTVLSGDYTVVGNVSVNAGVTVTIQAGTVIQFNSALHWSVDGTLLSQGTASQPVVFTSYRDNSPLGGGDSAGLGDWGDLQFNSDSTGNSLTDTQVNYGGWSGTPEVIDSGAPLTFNDGEIGYSNSTGLRVTQANPTLANDTFANNTNAAVSMDLASDPAITGVSLTNNGINGVELDSGSLSGSESWNNPDIVYWISGAVTVPQGDTLTVTAGQIVKAPYGYNDLIIDGTLNAQGTAAQPIIFTSYRDDADGGNTENDGSGTYTGVKGDWEGLVFGGTSTANLLDHVEVLYGGGWSATAGVIDSGAPLTFNDGVVGYSSTAGIRVSQANPTLASDSFTNNNRAAVSMDLASDPAITGVSLTNNSINGVELDSGSLSGSESWNNPDIVYWISGAVTVPQGDTLTVTAGQIVKAPYGYNDLIIDGTLNAQGTAAQPIIFTSYRDDADGGNTENDGSGTYTGVKGDWEGLVFGGTSTANLLDHVEVLYGGGWSATAGVIDSGAPLTFNDGVVGYSSTAGLRVTQANPTLANDTFANNNRAAVSMDLASDPAITGVSLTNNSINGVELDSGSLSGSESWNNPDIVYWISGAVTVPQGDTLTVTAGQIVKAPFGYNTLIINGTLTAQGTAAQPIIFTSYRDDADGGNTENDGSGTYTGVKGDWEGLQFGVASAANVLDHVEVLYGGGWGATAEVIDSGAPLIFNDGEIGDSSTAGLRVTQANPTLANDTFANNNSAAVSMDLASDPAITGVSLSNNGINGVELDSGTLSGSESWNNPDIVYWISGAITVPQGDALTVAAGQIVKAPFGYNTLIINGTLTAQGTAAQPIIFTSYRDDADGGNTENDTSGGTSTGSKGDWEGLWFSSTSTGNLLDHVEVLYGGGWGLTAEVIDSGAPLIFNDGEIEDSATTGMRITNANPVLNDDNIASNNQAAITQDLASSPALTNISFTGNQTNADVLDSGTLSANLSLLGQDVIYATSASITVPQGITLSIGANATFLAQSFHDFDGGGVINNAGIYSVVSSQNVYPQFVNSGSINLGSNTLNAAGGLSFGAGSTISGSSGAAIDVTGNMTGAVSVQAGSSIAINGGTLASCNFNSGAGGAVAFSNGTMTSSDLEFGNGSTVSFSNVTTSSGNFNFGDGSTVAVNGGTLTSSVFNIGPATTASFQNASVLGAVFNVMGAVNFSGTNTFGGAISGVGAGSVQLSGNLYTALGGVSLNFPGAMLQWTGGAFFAGKGDVTNLGTLTLSGSSDMGVFQDATLYNQGVIIQTGSGNLALHSDSVLSTVLDNETGAQYLIESNSGIDNEYGGATSIINAGTIRKTAGAGVSQLYVNGSLANTGVIEADSGSLFLDSSSVAEVSGHALTAGTWNAVNGATLELPSGTTITSNAATITLSGAGAAITGVTGLTADSGALTITDSAQLTAGAQFADSGMLTLGPGAVLNAGSFSQTATGLLTVAIAGPPSSNQYGQLDIQGAATFGGALAVDLQDGFSAERNTTYPIMTYASSSGAFSQVSGLAPIFTTQFTPTSLDLVNGSGATANLQLSSVSTQTSAVSGQTITVTWNVKNVGGTDATGNWQDTVYLSSTPVITSNSIVLGSSEHAGGLAAGASYSGSLETVVPALPPGNYYVLVQADSLDELNIANRANLVAAAVTGPLTIAVPSLTLGAPTNATFTATDEEQYFQVSVPTGGAVQITLTSAATSGAVALYVSPFTEPTPYSADYSAAAANELTQTVLIPSVPTPTIFYILAHGVSGSAASAGFTLTADPIAGLTVLPEAAGYSAGNGGAATLPILGTDFAMTTTASLSLGGTVISDSSIYYENSCTIFATFNLTGATLGSYSLNVTSGGQTVSSSTPVQVVAAKNIGNPVSLVLTPPDLASAGRDGVVSVTITNTSNDDVLAPLLDLTAVGATLKLPNQAEFQGASVDVLAVSPTGPAGTLVAGESVQETIQFQSITTKSSISFQVNRADDSQAVDWASQESALQIPTIPDAVWPIVFANFTAAVGTTVASYHSVLAADATYLAQMGEPTNDVKQLVEFEVEKANASYTAQTLANLTVDDLPAPGSDLTFKLSYQAAISGRYYQGLLGGQGWATNWDMKAYTTASGDVSIQINGSDFYFFLEPTGSYAPEAGLEGDVLTLSNGAYQLSEPNGTVFTFNTNGDFDSEQDAVGNRVAASYNGSGQMVKLTDSNGDQFQLGYNSSGQVDALTDSTGQTATFSYSGAFLTGVADLSETTTYSYETGGTAAQDGSLTEIANPNGTHLYFTYDSQGRLIDQHRDGGADDEQFTYLTPGGFTTTIGDPQETTTYFNLYGAVAETIDPLGNVSQYQYDANNNLIRSVSGGFTNSYVYNSLGDLVRATNAQGSTTTYSYNSKNDLTSSTDADGNTTSFSYSSTNELTSSLSNIHLNPILMGITTAPVSASGSSSASTGGDGEGAPPPGLDCGCPCECPTGTDPVVGTTPGPTGSSPNNDSNDPNAIIGPAGYGAPGYIRPDGTWSYTVQFENDGSAPALGVTVSQQLDPNLDWSSFQFNLFGFGSQDVTVPSGLTQYQTTVSYQNEDGTPLSVLLKLNFDVGTGLLTASFSSIDPATGQYAAGVYDGFLPPNNSVGAGEGFVSYTIEPRAGVANATPISQQASVVFDTNGSLATNVAANVIDTGSALSSNASVQAYSASTFTVNWSGQDPGGSGAASYNVYVSVNGGAYSLWQSDTTATSGVYTGQPGDTYAFYSVATDHVGNVQPTPSSAQATTSVAPVTTDISQPEDGAQTPITVHEALSSQYSDPDGAAFTKPGIAAVASSGNGTWQYSTNGSSWTAIGSLSVSSALLLPQSDSLRFVPAANWSGQAQLVFLAWDGSQGTAGKSFAVAAVGGASPFSSNAGSLEVSVHAEPLWSGAGADLPPLPPGSYSATNQTTPAGATVAAIFSSSFHDDNSAVAVGVAVAGLSGLSNGTWQYLLTGSSAWTNFPTVSSTSALPLAAADSVRFVPRAAFTGVVSLQALAWDGSVGVHGVTLNPKMSASAFSSTTRTATSAVNQAPTLGSTTGPTLATIQNDSTSATLTIAGMLTTSKYSDPDGSKLAQGIAVTGVTGDSGAWQYELTRNTWQSVPAIVSAASALLLPSTASLRFVSNGQNGQETLSYRGWDQTQGLPGGTFDFAAIGGAAAFSAATEVASIAVHQAPSWSAAAGADLTPLSPGVYSIADGSVPAGDSITEVFGGFYRDSTGAAGAAIVGTSGDGVWQYSLSGGAWISFSSQLSNSSALLLSSNDLIRFVPQSSSAAVGSLLAYAWDGSSGAPGNTVNLTQTGVGGTTAFSTGTITAGAAANTAPTLSVQTVSAFAPVAPNAVSAATTVSSLLTQLGYEDPDGQDLPDGIAISGSTTTAGSFQYQLSGGSWQSIPSVSTSSSLLLPGSASLRFVAGSQVGVQSLTVYGWDQTQGAAGQLFDIADAGGAAAFSATSATVSVTVRTAPGWSSTAKGYLSPLLPGTYSTTNASTPPGNTIQSVFGAAFVDATSGASVGVAISALSGAGTWQYSTTGGINWTALTGLSKSSAVLLAASDLIRFVPATTATGTATVTAFAWDGSSGAAGATVNLV